MRRILGGVWALALVIAACGGAADVLDPVASDDSPGEDGAAPTPAADADAVEPADPTAAPEANDADVTDDGSDCAVVSGFPAPPPGELPDVTSPQPIATVDQTTWADEMPRDDDIAVLAGYLYGLADGILGRIDPVTGVSTPLRVAAERLSGNLTAVSAAGGALWLVVHDDGSGALGETTELIRIDPADGCEEQRLVVPAPVREVQLAGESIWVNEFDRVYEVDPATGAIRRDFIDDEAFGISNFEAMGTVGDLIIGVGFCGSAAVIATPDGASFNTRFGDGDRQCGDNWRIGAGVVVASESSGEPGDPALGWTFDAGSGATVGAFALPFDVTLVVPDERGSVALGAGGELWRLPAPSTRAGDVPTSCLDIDALRRTSAPPGRPGDVIETATLDATAFSAELPGAFDMTVVFDALLALDGNDLVSIENDGTVTATNVPWFVPEAISTSDGVIWLSGPVGASRQLIGIDTGGDGCPTQVISTQQPALTVVSSGATSWVQGPVGALEIDSTSGAPVRTFPEAFAQATNIGDADLSAGFAENHRLFAPVDDPILAAVGPCGEIAGLQTESGEAAAFVLDRCELDGAVVAEWGFLLWSTTDGGGTFALYDNAPQLVTEGSIGGRIASVAAGETGAWLVTDDGRLWFVSG